MLARRDLPLPAPGPLVVRNVGRKQWATYDRLGERVTAFQSHKVLAEIDRDRLVAETGRKARPCLCCGSAFDSEGRHNRLCDRCRREEAGPVAVSWARSARRSEGARV